MANGDDTGIGQGNKTAGETLDASNKKAARNHQMAGFLGGLKDTAGKTTESLGKLANTMGEVLYNDSLKASDAIDKLGGSISNFDGLISKSIQSSLKFISTGLRISDTYRDIQRPLIHATALTRDFSGSLVSSTDLMDEFASGISEASERTGKSFTDLSQAATEVLMTSSQMATGIGDIDKNVNIAAKTMDSLTESVRLHRQTGMELNEVLEIQKSLFLHGGMAMDESSRAILELKSATKDTGVTIKQATEAYQDLLQTYEFLQFDSTQVAHSMGQVAEMAKQNTDAFRSPQQAIRTFKEGLKGVADVQQDLSQATFFGTMGGVGGAKGIEAALRFEGLEGTEALDVMTEQLGRMFGGRGVMTKEQALAEGGAAPEMFAMQREMIKRWTGMQTGQANQMMEIVNRMQRGDTTAAEDYKKLQEEAKETQEGLAGEGGKRVRNYQKQLLSSTDLMNKNLAEVRKSVMKGTNNVVAALYEAGSPQAKSFREFTEGIGKKLETGAENLAGNIENLGKEGKKGEGPAGEGAKARTWERTGAGKKAGEGIPEGAGAKVWSNIEKKDFETQQEQLKTLQSIDKGIRGKPGAVSPDKGSEETKEETKETKEDAKETKEEAKETKEEAKETKEEAEKAEDKKKKGLDFTKEQRKALDLKEDQMAALKEQVSGLEKAKDQLPEGAEKQEELSKEILTLEGELQKREKEKAELKGKFAKENREAARKAKEAKKKEEVSLKSKDYFAAPSAINMQRYGGHAQSFVRAGHAAGTEQSRHAFTQARMAGVVGKGSTMLERGDAMPVKGTPRTTPEGKKSIMDQRPIGEQGPVRKEDLSFSGGLYTGQLADRRVRATPEAKSKEFLSAEKIATQVKGVGKGDRRDKDTKDTLGQQSEANRAKKQAEAARKEAGARRAEETSTQQTQEGQPVKVVLNVDGRALAEAMVSTDVFSKAAKGKVNEVKAETYNDHGNRSKTVTV